MVGNLNVGGSGKTPMIEYLIRLLSTDHKVATLSRGYGRSTSGIRFATNNDSAQTIGDEPLQIHNKFGESVKVVVAEERAVAIPKIMAAVESVSVVLMDDGFQHRAVQPHLAILLTDYHRPFTRDYVLPAGNLRETRREARRADVIVVTRTPEIAQDKDQLAGEIRKYAPLQPVFFAGITYDTIQPFHTSMHPVRDVILLTAIAQPDHMVSYVKQKFNLLRHFNFPDHHLFTVSELAAVSKEQEKTGASIITTEKDMMRLRDPQLKEWISNKPWYYLPIRMYFYENGAEFDTMIRRRAR